MSKAIYFADQIIALNKGYVAGLLTYVNPLIDPDFAQTDDRTRLYFLTDKGKELVEKILSQIEAGSEPE